MSVLILFSLPRIKETVKKTMNLRDMEKVVLSLKRALALLKVRHKDKTV
jgi:hypothetical protein